MIAYAGIAAGLIIAATVAIAFLTRPAQAADDDPPLMLARDGYFYVNAKTTTVDGRDYVSHQMYVEVRLRPKQTVIGPIIMARPRTMSAANISCVSVMRSTWWNSRAAGSAAISRVPTGPWKTSSAATILRALSHI